MNFSVSRFPNGAAKVRIIFNSPNLFAKFFKLFFFAPVFHQNSSQPVFRIGSAKVRLFYLLPNLFQTGNAISMLLTDTSRCNRLKTKSLQDCYIFVKYDGRRGCFRNPAFRHTILYLEIKFHHQVNPMVTYPMEAF